MAALDATAQGQTPQGQGTGTSPMPQLDYGKLAEYMKAHKAQQQGAAVPPATPQAPAQQPMHQLPPKDAADNPDVAQAQNEFKDVKEGDTYTDANGQQWQWSVVEYQVVPEDVKDEEVDALSSEEGGEEPQGEEEEALSDEEALNRGLDIALSVLREGVQEDASDAAPVADEAVRLVWAACDEILGIPTGDAYEELNGKFVPSGKPNDGYSDGLSQTYKRQGYTGPVDRPAPNYLVKKGKVHQINDNTNAIGSYMSNPEKSAKEKALKTHRRFVAATYDKCRAKNKVTCPYHGAAYMTAQLAKIIKANGVPLGKFAILMHDPAQLQNTDKKVPLQYRLVFSTPVGTPEDVRRKIAKDFFTKNPSIIVQGEGDENSIFSLKGHGEMPIEEMDDLPIDAPDYMDYEALHDTEQEASYNWRARQATNDNWWSGDSLAVQDYFSMLSERPTNGDELNEDLMRYVFACPEALEGTDLKEDAIKALYERYRDAAANKQGLQAYLKHGQMVDMAQALADAAEQGLEKEGKNYYDAAKEIYDEGHQVFNAVQSYLEDRMMGLKDKMKDLPTAKQVSGDKTNRTGQVTGLGVAGAYAGSKYSVKDFPWDDIPGESGKQIRKTAHSYISAWSSAANCWDEIREGCETRDPMLVIRGLSKMDRLIANAQGLKENLGRMQDEAIDAMSEKRRKKLGVKEAGAEKPKHPEQQTEHPAPKAPKEKQSETKEKPASKKRTPPKIIKKPKKTEENPEPAKESPTAEKKTAKPTSKEKAPAKESKPKVDYAKVFAQVNEKIGEIANGNSIKDLMEVYGYEVKPYESKDGRVHHLLVRPGTGPSGIDTTKPYYLLDNVYEKRRLGEGGMTKETFFAALKEFSKARKPAKKSVAEANEKI